MGHLVWLSMMTLWTGFKQQNFASDESIGPNEEEETYWNLERFSF